MGKRTQKVGISGKFGTRYGASLRKLIRKIEVSQHAKYDCVFCGKKTVTRVSTGIWNCSACKKTSAGGSYVLVTPAAATVRSNLARMRKVAEGAEAAL